VWNFEWSINTDYTGGRGLLLDDLTYEIYLAAFRGGREVARTSITIHNGDAALVPEPSATLLFPVALFLAGATVPRSRRRKLAS
jgi:predicted dehydrogenase